MELKKICCIATVTAAALMTGCETTGKTGPQPPPPPPAYTEVTFPVWPVFTKAIEQREFRGDLMKIVELGISLSDTGQHEKAANIFLQGAKDFTSKGARLEQAFISAAIMEHFKAGKIALVREDFKKLDALRTNPYNNYDDNDNIRKIRAIVKAN